MPEEDQEEEEAACRVPDEASCRVPSEEEKEEEAACRVSEEDPALPEEAACRDLTQVWIYKTV